MKNISLTILFTFILLSLYSQDLHFSQLDLNTTMRNPATMGQMPAENKITLGYRSQWTNLPYAYRNINVAFEHRMGAFSLGTDILHNDAGRNSLRTTQLLLKLAYQKRLSERDEILAIGVSGGALQQRFQPELFEFDNQYIEGVGFDKSRSNGETFARSNQFLPTINAGVFISKYLNRIKMSAGLSFSHLNRPASEFFEGQKVYYPVRTSLFASAKLFFRKKLRGEIRYARNSQFVANETIVGAKLNYELSPHKWITFGVSNRIEDAFIFEAGLEFQYSSFTVSYDMNNSNYAAVSQGNGALELTATYAFSKKDKYKQLSVAMPFSKEKKEEELIVEEKKEISGVDSDGDGIVDNKDECPEIPGLVQFDGCNDSDKDGVWDSMDACPNLFGEKENRGCPLIYRDTDKDGLTDEVDNCPYIKGIPALGGCPDTDLDGVSDLNDNCPFLKGDPDNHGCPKMNREEHQTYIGEKTKNTIVEFETNRVVIRSQYFAELDEIALLLLKNRDAEAFISGHTDDEGNNEYNFQLGEQRAHAIQEYFMQVGVSPKQLTVISYGENKPRNANRSAYEKSKNRRAEVMLYLK